PAAVVDFVIRHGSAHAERLHEHWPDEPELTRGSLGPRHPHRHAIRPIDNAALVLLCHRLRETTGRPEWVRSYPRAIPVLGELSEGIAAPGRPLLCGGPPGLPTLGTSQCPSQYVSAPSPQRRAWPLVRLRD